jgi:hypothetical protein
MLPQVFTPPALHLWEPGHPWGQRLSGGRHWAAVGSQCAAGGCRPLCGEARSSSPWHACPAPHPQPIRAATSTSASSSAGCQSRTCSQGAAMQMVRSVMLLLPPSGGWGKALVALVRYGRRHKGQGEPGPHSSVPKTTIIALRIWRHGRGQCRSRVHVRW